MHKKPKMPRGDKKIWELKLISTEVGYLCNLSQNRNNSCLLQKQVSNMKIKFTRCQQAQSLAQTKETFSLNHCQSNLSIF